MHELRSPDMGMTPAAPTAPLPVGLGPPLADRDAATALRESEERFRLLVDGVADYAIYMLDPAGKIVSWNKGAERLKGYTEAEILGKDVSAFFLPDDVAAGK